MRAVESEIIRLGGIASANELSRAGFTAGLLRGAVHSSRLTRVRKGWYALASADVDVLRAWRVGGRLACVSAAAHHGLWVPDTMTTLHVSVPVSAARLRAPTAHNRRLSEIPDADTRIHWDGPSGAGDRVALPVDAAIAQAFRCAGNTLGFVLLESALRLGRLDPTERRALAAALPAAAARIASYASSLSDSGIESLVKLILVRLGLPFEQQVVVEGVGRVDFLIGERLVVEVDGRHFHADAYKDRKRDALLSVAGKRVLRFLYAQVVYEPETVEAAIVAAIARSDHNRA